jgi:hypothetical protein
MPTVTVKTTEIEKLQKDLKAVSVGVRPEIRKAMLQGTILVTRNIKEEIRNPAPFPPLIAGKANNMFQTWTQSVSDDGLHGASYSPKIYSDVMRRGRRAGARRPPREVIENWIKDKRIDPWKVIGVDEKKSIGRMKRRQQASSSWMRSHRVAGKKLKFGAGAIPRAGSVKRIAYEKAVKQAAFVIARSIGKKGIKGRFYSDIAVTRSMAQLNKIFSGVADFVVRKTLGAA